MTKLVKQDGTSLTINAALVTILLLVVAGISIAQTTERSNRARQSRRWVRILRWLALGLSRTQRREPRTLRSLTSTPRCLAPRFTISRQAAGPLLFCFMVSEEASQTGRRISRRLPRPIEFSYPIRSVSGNPTNRC